ncbi:MULTISPECIES: heme-degrading domain-containing protein [Subtercola]|uniref:Heme-degrading domain-containing protein n=1 Tax=Subtercola vilae TaxID=2056433 RepID=A0A4T2CBY6_9MICO|nr:MULTISPECIES: heme-degrading domain-containing protein [Subtercola]MEA9985018.1 heme-degrading domain-containing protein [Subtercola sp. RTI3]TIH39958.1 heme-degrading domain-containing protein [Subtercola vilae]
MPSRDDAIFDEAEHLERLRAQERLLQFESFDYDDAWAVGSRLRDGALEQDLPIAISIVFGQQRVFHAGLSGSSADNDGWLERKFNVVRRFNEASFTVGTLFRSRGTTFEASSRLDPNQFSAHGGAFPIRVRGSIVGIVGVSGLAQADDHDLVVEALTWLRGEQ